MKSFIKILNRIINIVIILATLACSHIYAVISIDPTINEVMVVPGKKTKGVINVRNTGGQNVTVFIEVQEWWRKQSGLEGLPIKKWLKLNVKKPFKLAPGKKRKIKYSIKLPKSWNKEAMAMVFFTGQTEKPRRGEINLQLRNGISIYAIPEGEKELAVVYRGFEGTFSGEKNNSIINLNARLANKCEFHIRPKIFLKIYKDDDMIEQVEFEYGWPIFPRDTHGYKARTKKSIWETGIYKAELVVDSGPPYNVDNLINQSFTLNISETGDVILE